MYYESVSRDEYLAHHGVKGQKWGIRRKRTTLGGSSRAQRKQQKKLMRQMMSETGSLSDQFKRSEAGKAATEKVRRAFNAYDRANMNWDGEDTSKSGKARRAALNNLWSAQEDAGRAQAKHVVNSLNKKYGAERVSASGISVDSLAKQYANDYDD